MKILVFNGSPKRDKSDTMHITRAFLGGILISVSLLSLVSAIGICNNEHNEYRR